MLNENVFAIADVQRDNSEFFARLMTRFKTFEAHHETESLMRSVIRAPSNSLAASGSLLILFVEYPYLDNISSFLSENYNPGQYILVAFYNTDCPDISEYKAVFDFVNTGSNTSYIKFMLNRLNMEIDNKNRLALLQFEVREFYEIGKSLSSEKDTIKLFEMIINSSMSMTSSDAGTIYLSIDKETGTWSPIKNNLCKDKLLKFIIARNLSMETKLEAFITPVTKASIFGYTAITGKSLRIDDAYNISVGVDYGHAHKYDKETGYVTKSMLSIPMKDHEDNVMGVIQLINKKKVKNEKLDYKDKTSLANIIPYDYTDELIMNSLAGQAAVVLENSLLYRDMQDLLSSYKEQNSQLLFLSTKVLKAHEEERRRIAREIHDGPAQSSVNLSLKLELCKKYFQNNDYEKLTSEMNTLSGSIRETVKEIRTIIYDLKPSYLDDGLKIALKNRLEVFMENSGIKVFFNPSGDDAKVEYYMTSTIYRIVQETLSNILKHAHAQTVKVSLNISDKDLLLIVDDDGTGFDTSKLKSGKQRNMEGGFGIEGIQERVELVRGSMEIHSKPGKGTSVKVRIPLV